MTKPSTTSGSAAAAVEPTPPEPRAARVPRRCTISDVAAAAGVSRSAVSFVLSDRPGVRLPEATRQRILEAAERVGYRRNALGRALRSGRVDAVGIIAPLSVMVGDPDAPGGVYYKDLTVALAAAAFEAGLNPLLMSEEPRRHISLADLSDRRVDGVIVVSKANSETFVEEAASAGVPCVTINRDVGEWRVQTDNVRGGRLAVEHLVGLGHRRIAYLAYDDPSSVPGRQRRDGYVAALADAGLRPVPAEPLHFQDPDAVRAALRDASGPTAVCCFNDELAVWLLNRCREEGVRVPDDLSVVGFDNNVLAVTARPRLTTVRSPLAELARTALSLFEQQQRGGAPPPAPVLVEPDLVVRDSTAAPSSRG
ncbi:MAG TPA: LacI family DNA-binding transcriptional regulator [Armatimonadaceae bacterium]|nr:LacI family DNA-binding transcriptional regulator [Armatimonadaceae bacterium]